MAKSKINAFFCQECGYESAKWLGQCPACRAWNTFVEEPAEKKTSRGGLAKSGLTGASEKKLSEISMEKEERMLTGIRELDRVLGGGVVAGSLILVGGDPGIGKSTLLLQVCRNLSETKKVYYISGEESLQQIKLRADRIGTFSGDRKSVV